MTQPGRVAIVLHTHMPYVEGFGTWPFGEEWLWEAIATSYLPVADLLDAGAPLTLSLTPVLCDQLEAPGALHRCAAFLREMRPESHRRDAEGCRDGGRGDLAEELERAAGQYAAALAALEACEGNLLARLAPHAAWTSSATHAILPLLATNSGVRLQVENGVQSHRERFPREWRGGFWIPECAHEPWIDRFLEEAGVHAACVELTEHFGAGDARNLRPLRSADGPLLVPIDRALIDLVWGSDGYPAGGPYRDSHQRTTYDHRPWANDGEVYDAARAEQQAKDDAADFAARCGERVADGGLCTLAFDTELFGLWWHEGPVFLEAFIDACQQQGVELTSLDDALEQVESEPWPSGLDTASSWGKGHSLKTWSSPKVAAIAGRTRDAELRALAAGPGLTLRAGRELLALQASDWAFLEADDLAGPYPLERFRAHLDNFNAELASVPLGEAVLRNLAPTLSLAPLLEP